MKKILNKIANVAFILSATLAGFMYIVFYCIAGLFCRKKLED